MEIQKRSKPGPGRLSDHVLITGASSGLGWALAEHYAAPGVTLSLCGRDAERLSKIAALCTARGAEVVIRQIDVTDAKAMQNWIAERDADRALDLVIANAGFGGSQSVPGPQGETSAQANQIVAVNTLGVLNTVTPALPLMAMRGCGRVVIIGSISSAIGLPQSPVYCGSKAAIKIYGDGIRRLVRSQGVYVTIVLPGFMDTPMSRSLPMPFPWVWTAQKAARRIARDTARRAAYSIFPWQLRVLIGLQSVLPVTATDFILRLTAKTAWPNANPTDGEDQI